MSFMYTVQCIECNYIFGDFEVEFGLEGDDVLERILVIVHR